MIRDLGMLQQKTKATLAPEEQQFLEQALFELRMRFVRASKAHPGSSNPEAMAARVTFLGPGPRHGRAERSGSAAPPVCRRSAVADGGRPS